MGPDSMSADPRCIITCKYHPFKENLFLLNERFIFFISCVKITFLLAVEADISKKGSRMKFSGCPPCINIKLFKTS